MKILLTAINAKYIHSNLAVYSLRAYANARGHQAELAEYTINQRTDYILEEIYRRKPDVLVFSCYIWNIDYVVEIAQEYHKICPGTPIWAGGPEVSFETETFLKKYPAFTGVMMGEGERTFENLCRIYEEAECTAKQESCTEKHIHQKTMEKPRRRDFIEEQLLHLEGISFRREDGIIVVQPLCRLLSMDELPFCYEHLEDFSHRIIYYESSRGCPFNCSYCLSSVDKTLRFRSLELVYRELQFFLDHQVPQVKFVDRTFNCKHDHALAVWRYIADHDNGVTNFHFEVSADLLNEEELELISHMRPGLIQLEIGVQSTHPETIREIHRSMRLSQVKKSVERVQQGKNIHQHLDLIAGLPFEDFETFQRSFDDIYAWKPDQLQLGFLKVLKGSYMYEHAGEYGILYRSRAPYEVLSTRWLTYSEVLEIHLVENMLEIHYNSGQFRTALRVLETCYDSAFQMFLEMGHFFRTKGYLDCSHSRVRRTEIFLEFAGTVDPGREKWYQEALIFDLYRIEKSKSRPVWARNLMAFSRQSAQYLREHEMEKKYCHIEPFRYLRLGEDGPEIIGLEEQSPERYHMMNEEPEHLTGGKDIPAGIMPGKSESEKERQSEREETLHWILFDYEKRNPLTNEAALREIFW